MDSLSKVTARKLKFWTNPSNNDNFKMDLIISGITKPPEGMYVFGVTQLTNVDASKVKPLRLKLEEDLDLDNENDLEKIAKALSDYLTKHPDHVIVADSNYKYHRAILYLSPELTERVYLIEYKPIVTPAPAWVRLLIIGGD